MTYLISTWLVYLAVSVCVPIISECRRNKEPACTR